jgi:hypothetical protein
MKIKTVCLLLLSASALDIQMENRVSGDDDSTPEDDGLTSLLSSALAGAKPGIIKEPTAVQNKDKEGDKQVTSGFTRNYKFHWQYACAFTKWIPSN